jgi:hypothetical protein
VPTGTPRLLRRWLHSFLVLVIDDRSTLATWNS